MYTDRIADWMSTPPIVVAPTCSLATAQRLMEQRHVRRLPMVKYSFIIVEVYNADTTALHRTVRRPADQL